MNEVAGICYLIVFMIILPVRLDYVNILKNLADLLPLNVTQKIHDTHATHIMNGTMDCWFQDQGRVIKYMEFNESRINIFSD